MKDWFLFNFICVAQSNVITKLKKGYKVIEKSVFMLFEPVINKYKRIHSSNP